MTSRERLKRVLNHQDVDKVVVDLGSSVVSGISATALINLREALGLKKELVKISEPFQLLGEVTEDVRKALSVDIVSVSSPMTIFGYKNENWKKWEMPNGLTVLVGENFNTTKDKDGNTYIYPQGDLSVPPSARMPKEGFYFDNIVRQEEIDPLKLDAKEDFKNDFSVMSDDIIAGIKKEVDYYYDKTEYGISLGSFQDGIGDFCPLSAPWLKYTKGIRNIEDFMMAHYLYPDYIKELFGMQTDIALKNIKKLFDAVGNKVQIIQINATDFGTQNGEMISPEMYREFYKPYFKKINDWVHENTEWKVAYHSCGSVIRLLDDFVEINVDILNPVQCSAKNMDPKFLKEKYGDKLVFWGGGVDTQKTLPFGNPEDVKKEVLERLEIFSKNGGFIFNTIHNIQGPTPVENILAIYEAIKEFNLRKK
ncbi:MAG: uroporphyrinogen decarboxylase family protein [Fusobacteriaceae bacterium]